ncbi:MAG: RNase adapter RapZ [Eubacterium sp.]|nr:RNase adapter RapZ [Eubacterium sp.]
MTEEGRTEVVIVTGLSGAGKTQAADWFEDHGYYVIDNMPPSMIGNFLELEAFDNKSIQKVAFVVDIRSHNFMEGLEEAIEKLNESPAIDSGILFIEASDDTLVKRYNETRRTHPLNKNGGITTREVVQKERDLLEPFRRKADHIIDTTHMKQADMFADMSRIYEGLDTEKHFTFNIMSFGYKFGIPQGIDMVFDMRFIPNPFYIPSLKKLTGHNKKVSQYVLKQDVTQEFLTEVDNMMKTLVPHYIKEGKYSLSIAIGCTGGQHRSVAVANELARMFSEEGYRVTIEHREH